VRTLAASDVWKWFRWWHAAPLRLWVFLIALIAYLASALAGHAPYDTFVRLASAFLHGRLWVDSNPIVGAVLFDGHSYVTFGFMPAIVSLPLVLLLGLQANQAVACAIAAATGVCAAWVMLGRMRLARRVQVAVTAFFAFGTVYFWCAAFGSVWQFEHVAGALFAVLGLAEWYGARRPLLLGVLFACMALSRLPMALAGIPFAVWLVVDARKGERAHALAQSLLGALPLVLLYAIYNYGRWHTFADEGYALWFHADAAADRAGVPFQLKFLPANLYGYLILPPILGNQFPWLLPHAVGVALTFTSPALALAFLAPARSRETWHLWAAALLAAIPSLLYYQNGYEQFGMRHSLDFLPFLLPLVARGLARLETFFTYALVGFSILANAYGIWYSWAFHAYSVVPR